MSDEHESVIMPVDSDTTKKAITKGVDRYRKNKEKVRSLNEDNTAIISDLRARGIHPKALKFAIAYEEADEDTRQQIDLTMQIVRDALGIGQTDMFDPGRSSAG